MKLDELAYQTAIQAGKDLAGLRERIEKLEKELEQLKKEELGHKATQEILNEDGYVDDQLLGC